MILTHLMSIAVVDVGKISHLEKLVANAATTDQRFKNLLDTITLKRQGDMVYHIAQGHIRLYVLRDRMIKHIIPMIAHDMPDGGHPGTYTTTEIFFR